MGQDLTLVPAQSDNILVSLARNIDRGDSQEEIRIPKQLTHHADKMMHACQELLQQNCFGSQTGRQLARLLRR